MRSTPDVHVTASAAHVVSNGVQHCVGVHATPSQTTFAALLMIDVPANVGAGCAHEAVRQETVHEADQVNGLRHNDRIPGAQV
jgi:hypothetical protein